MKLVIVSAAYPPMRAGEADHVYHLSENLALRGIEVHVITTPLDGLSTGVGCDVHPVMRDWTWRELPRLINEIRRISPDVVLLYYIGWIYRWHPMITFLPWLLKKGRPDIRFITEFTNIEGAEPQHFSLGSRVVRKCMMWWSGAKGVDYSYGTLLRDTDSFVVLSQIHASRLAALLPDARGKIAVIPPPPIMKLCQADPVESYNTGRKLLDLGEEEFLFAYFGYVYPGKGVETLLEAFRIVAQFHSKARLLILGGAIAKKFPDQPDYLEKLLAMPVTLGIHDKVIWFGEYDWDSDQASNCLRAAQVCVLPFDDGVQLNNSSFAAAVAHALPVIATQGTILEDAFVHRENVMLCAPKDERGLAEAMETLISDPDLACRLKNGARDMAAEWFSWSKAIDRTISMLASAENHMSLEINGKAASVRKREPEVSVCVPTYNGAAYLRECLDSVLNQACDDFEILLVDDCSTDHSVSICEEYARLDRRVRLFVNEKNLGLVQNWNRCVDLAKGKWVKFVFQDDIIMPSCISRMLEVSRPDVDLVAVRRNLMFAPDTSDSVRETYIGYVSEHDLARHFSDYSYISPENLSRFLLRVPDRNCIGEPTATMVRKRAFAKFGYFNSKLVSLCDWEYFARVGVNTGLCYINEPLASFRVHGGARSSELREHWGYAADVIDSLIIHHDMTYLAAYSPLRIVAGYEKPPIRLRYKLADAVRRARWQAISMNDDGKAIAELRRTLKSYPKLFMIPPGYVIGLGLQKLHLRAD